MTARRGATTRTPTAKPAVPETLAAAAARVASAAPVLGGLRAKLEEIAVATGAYRRTLIREGIDAVTADRYVDAWQESLWISYADEIDETPDDDEIA